ncbi:Non-syndromic hearing impairment protein 5-like protein [Nibea albiflora]|uniref:Non-syndromic hearing impairment protein 5-like protein n=1 Tax=Nibea albiflora TaxID=240163 RepID=A0ACB7ESU8_NIBAL|nr:Non-syndromic hearing impairment protein 5-like protein [Nibea albiflora]
MFSKATAKFVRQIDQEGSLIHVSRINDSDKLVPMALVVKRNPIWFWQKPKYQPTVFTLSDLLQGDEVLTPGVSEKYYLDYKGKYGDIFSGKLDAEAGHLGVMLEGRGSSMLQSCFGKLKKEELDVKKLLNDSSGRQVDMQHPLVQQLKKQAEVLAVVNERILTTDSCTVTQTKKEQCAFKGMLGIVGVLGNTVKVCVKDSNNIEMDSDVSLEIPSKTVIAYSILELEIKKNGHYEICLQPGTTGGIESDSIEMPWPCHDPLEEVDGKYNGDVVPEKGRLGALQNGSPQLDLSPLADLPDSTRSALFKNLLKTLKDRPTLSYLQCVLQDLCCVETPEVAKLDQLKLDSPAENGQSWYPPCSPKSFSPVALPDGTLGLLSKSCPDFLEAFHMLTCKLKESSEPLSIECPPFLLQDNQAFQLAEQLLGSIDVTLRRDADRLRMETGSNGGDHLLVLCLGIHGLSLLCKGLKWY